MEAHLTRDQYGIQYVAGTVRNNTSQVFMYVEVGFNAYDRSGNMIGNAWTNVANLGAHDTWSFQAIAPQGMFRWEFSEIQYTR